MPGFSSSATPPPAGGALIEAQPGIAWPLVELRGVLMGHNQTVRIGPPGVRGLGVTVKSVDTDLAHDHGDYPAEDFNGPLTLTVPLLFGAGAGATPSTAWSDYWAMRPVWSAGGDEELHLQMPGVGHVYVIGRARGLDEDPIRLKSGLVAALATFKANNPTVYTSTTWAEILGTWAEAAGTWAEAG